MNLFDMVAEDDARRLEQARAEIAAEKAAWDALSPEDQAAHIAAVEAKYPDVPETDEDEIEEEDDDNG